MKRAFEKIFAQCPADELVGRKAELDALLSLPNEDTSDRLVILAAPRVGASELLRQAYDRLFLEQTHVSPFYFRLKAADRSAQIAARRFVCEFILQTVAFSRRDPGIISSSPPMAEIAELAAPADGYWIDRLVQAASSGNDQTGFTRHLLSAPQRAAANGARPIVFIDDVHVATQLDGGETFLSELIEIFSRSLYPMTLSGQRRFLFGKAFGDIIDLEAFPVDEASQFVERRAARSGVEINDQTRDLVAVQLDGSAGHMATLIDAAAMNGDEFSNFDDVERVYTDEIFGGGVAGYFDDIFEIADAGNSVLRLLAETAAAAGNRLPISYWTKHSRAADVPLMFDVLHRYEIVNVDSGCVGVDTENTVLSDYISARLRLEVEGESRAFAVGTTLSENLKRAPMLMARSYRRGAAIGLKELLESFDGRQISPAVLDYERFKNELKGADEETVHKALKEDNQRLRLPQIVFATHIAAVYPPIGKLSDLERTAVGFGFVDGARRDEVVWLAAEIDSKLEAHRDSAEFWCDRLEMAAAACGFAQFTIWLIAPEGFAPNAVEALRERNAYGSSRRQVELLAAMLDTEIGRPAARRNGKEYEFEVAMGTGGEMSTAHNVEEIGQKHNIPSKVVNQLKTALIEASINAAEHSFSPDGKIHQKFIIEPDRITVVVTNRGVRLIDKKPSEPASDEGRRGWGLKLIEGLMDEVSIGHTDDGTCITMTKMLTPTANDRKKK